MPEDELFYHMAVHLNSIRLSFGMDRRRTKLDCRFQSGAVYNSKEVSRAAYAPHTSLSGTIVKPQ